MGFGRFDPARPQGPIADINVTPLVDVMLVLVVILILTAPLLASSIPLELPRAEGAGQAEGSRSLTLVVDRAGQTYLNDEALSLDALSARLRSAGQSNADTEIQLRADAAVPYGTVARVMGLAHQAGLSRIAFITERAP